MSGQSIITISQNQHRQRDTGYILSGVYLFSYCKYLLREYLVPSIGLQMVSKSAVSALTVAWAFHTSSHLILPITYAVGTRPHEETDSERLNDLLEVIWLVS